MSDSTFSRIVREAEKYLQDNKKTSSASAAKSKDIVDHILRMIDEGKLDADVAKSTIYVYLSNAANSSDWSLVSGGPWGGYWYDESFKSEEPPAVEEEVELSGPQESKVKFYEKDLYPLIIAWLSTKGYKGIDISSLKRGGKWGNPDVIGVTRVEFLGAIEIELVSCEVKLSDDSWERFIFEAISHKRFSNRSWFCYRVSESARPMPKNMEYYAERYRVGIVQIRLSDKELLQLKSSKDDPLEFVDKISERVPANFDAVPLQERKSVFDRSGIDIDINLRGKR